MVGIWNGLTLRKSFLRAENLGLKRRSETNIEHIQFVSQSVNSSMERKAGVPAARSM